MSPATETGFEDVDTEVLRNLWLAKWGSEPVAATSLCGGVTKLEVELEVRGELRNAHHNNTCALRPHANN